MASEILEFGNLEKVLLLKNGNYLYKIPYKDYFGDARVSLEERLDTYRRFLEVWHRRHDLAIKQQEPRLVHENGDLKHVMIVDDQFLFFDFEMTYRSRARVQEFVTREILAYLKSLGKIVGPQLYPDFLEQTVDHYPGTGLLQNAYQVMFAHSNPVIRLARFIDRKLSARAAKPFSKYNVARQLKDMLENRPDRDG